MVLAAVPARVVQAQGSYSERLNVYVAGSDALWYFTYSGLNSSGKLSAFESSPGLSSYNVTAIRTTGWSSDFQMFGPMGYNLLPVPFIPTQGLFLTVGSDSFGDAKGAASALGSYMLTSFASFSNGTGTYTFYAPFSFASLVPSTLLRLIPTTEHGFAGAVGASWASTPSPFISVNGQKESSGFVRNLVIGSITASALDATRKPNVLSYFGSTITQLRASSHSSSSVVKINFLDGIVSSKDTGATVSKDSSHFTGSYALTIAPGKHVSKFNATVVEQPAGLLATRSVSSGVLRTGNDFAVTLSLRNLSPSSSITKISFSDNWWNGSGNFKFLSGNYTAPSTPLSPGSSITPVYRLEYTGSTTGSVTVPPSVVRYSYSVGGVNFNATARLDPIRLSLGADDAVVVATVVPIGGLGKSVGDTQRFNVTVTNVGTQPASSVVVAGKSISGLAGQSGGTPGGTATVTVSQSASGTLGINLTKSYAASYQDPAGSSLNSTTNIIPDVFSHSAMKLGFPSLTLGVKVSVVNQRTNLTIGFTTANSGRANITNFAASESLPPGLGCGKIVGKSAATKGVTCTSGKLTIDYSVVNASTSLTAFMEYNITVPQSFLLVPALFTAASGSNNLTGRSNASPVPTGMAITKQFNPSQLFPGMTSQVTVSASNGGPFRFYNASISTTVDSFDSLSVSSNLTKSAALWESGASKSFSYSVTLTQVSGLQKGSVPTVNFFFGGTPFSLAGVEPSVSVYAPIAVTISTNPATPEEGKNFTMTLRVSNPSGVAVSDVHFTLPLPSGLGLSSLNGATVTAGILDIFDPALGSDSNVSASVRVVASSGIVIPFERAKLTFSYSGIIINGVVPKNGIAIAEDVTTRYIIPTGFIILVVLFVAFYVRRKAGATAPSSRK
jgi:hypothetical protein